MALCTKCIIQGVVQGGQMRPIDDVLRLEFGFSPDADDEVVGDRSLLFEGRLREGDAEEGLSATGVLVGNFAISPDEERREEAQVEVFTRGGETALVVVEVRDETGRVTFQANLKGGGDGKDGLGGVVFLANTQTA